MVSCSMASPIISLVFINIFVFLITSPLRVESTVRSPSKSRHSSSSRITVVGAVYCDTCSSNAFTKHSYFLPGVDVQIRCKFKEKTKRSTEQVNYAANTTTDKYGVYKVEISAIEGLNCADGVSFVSMCQSTLLRPPQHSSDHCNIPSLKTASNAISVKSTQDNLCIYSLNALSYKPSSKNASLCAHKRGESNGALEASKCFFPWPNVPPFFHMPPFSSLPWPFNIPFPFPFSNLPPFPPMTPLSSPPPSPPPFSLWDPTTWIPFAPPPP